MRVRTDSGDLNEAGGYGEMKQLGEIVQIEFFHRVCAVNFCSPNRDSQLGSDLLIAVSKSDESNDFAFPGRQIAKGGVAVRPLDSRRIEESAKDNPHQSPT